ncbi:hypothetical protein CFP65_5849 [Kitasatospora sp. MMS16-BH015]|uniref:hypothetical protein n=1 Tax=Kitasatospora sp. MMS16-BH015 TaxID=2018025 RepID=UPI000CA21792|nr:hypothetical protein [Kitasatospora sp. MMS16-BH015]AUG80530.1 hypothetical protein CFP65_5849 [Kitasatospora sp. MMS16-BH015]
MDDGPQLLRRLISADIRGYLLKVAEALSISQIAIRSAITQATVECHLSTVLAGLCR